MNETIAAKKGLFQLNVDTQALVKRLEKAQMDDLIPYTDLSAVIGANVQGSARSILTSARRIVERDNSIVFDCVRGEGLRRMNNSAVATSGHATITHIHRVSHRAGRRIACADFASLSAEDKTKSNTHLSLFGALAQVTRPTAIKQLSAAVQTANEKLPVGRVLDAFKQ